MRIVLSLFIALYRIKHFLNWHDRLHDIIPFHQLVFRYRFPKIILFRGKDQLQITENHHTT